MLRSLVAVLALVGCGVAAADEIRPLKLEAVDAVIEKNDRAVQACQKGARRDPHAVILKMEIDAEGAVTFVAAAMPKPDAEAQCLSKLAKRLKFPSTGTHSHVEYPFMLMPKLGR
jgi:hypothetical protein